MTEHSTPSASPLSTSIKSDSDDSFMDHYVPMRPRTSSDSFNYRHRTSSFGKMQPVSRPRSSSHGQGTRPIIKLGKVGMLRGDQRSSLESSLHNSFESLRMSHESLRRGESLRRTSQDASFMRQMSGSNASDYADARSTPSPLLRRGKDELSYMCMTPGAKSNDGDSYMSMTPGAKSNDGESYMCMTPGAKSSDGESYMSMTPGAKSSDGDSYMSMTPGSSKEADSGSYMCRNTDGSDSGTYMSMAPGRRESEGSGASRKTSPHRVRTDSSGSGRRSESKLVEGKPYFCGPQSQQDDYTEMTPLSLASSASSVGDSYMNMDFIKQAEPTKPAACPAIGSSLSSAKMSSSAYMNMDMDQKLKAEAGRSVSLENVDSKYVVYDPAHSSGHSLGATDYVGYDPSQASKPRTGSLGSKDKKCRPGSGRKNSSSNQNQTTVSMSSRKGGSSDSLRKTTRQSSIEKTGSLGKDFRKKSGSTGTRPDQGKAPVPVRRVPSSQSRSEEPNDEYIEFDPSVTVESLTGAPPTSRSSQTSSRSQQAARNTLSPADQDQYTMFSPGLPPTSQHSSPHTHQPSPPHSSLYSHPPMSRSQNCHTASQPNHWQSHKSVSQSLNSKTSPHQSKASSQTRSISQVIPQSKPPLSAIHVRSRSSDETEYIGYQPGPSPSCVSSQAKHIEVKEVPAYVGFDPARPTAHPTQTNKSPHAAVEQSDYVGYQPNPDLTGHRLVSVTRLASPGPTSRDKPTSQPTGLTHSTRDSNTKTKSTGTHHRSVDPSTPRPPSTKSPSPVTASTSSRSPKELKMAQMAFSSQLTSPSHSKTPAQHKPAHAPQISVPLNMNVPQIRAPHPLNVPLIEAPHLVSAPQVQAPQLVKNSQIKAPQFASVRTTPPGTAPTCQLQHPPAATDPQPTSLSATDPQPTLPPPASVTPPAQGGDSPANKNADKSDYLDFCPSVPSITPSSMLKENTAPRAPPASPRPATSSQLEQQTCQLSVEPKSSRRLQQPKFDRQLSAPAEMKDSWSCDSPVCASVTSVVPSPLSLSTADKSSKLSRADSGSTSGVEVFTDKPTGRLKHNSGPTCSPLKSHRKGSSDSDKPLRKGSKSDSNSSISSLGKNKKWVAGSGDKCSLEGSEKSPLSPASKGSGEFFSDSALTSDLEGKMVPVEAKIRLSLGDMTSVVVNKDCGNLSRPGSTPCMQTLDPVVDAGCLAGTEESAQSDGLSGQRSRHSLSDLGAYQQMNLAGKTCSSSSVDAGGDHAASGSHVGGSRSTIGSEASTESGSDMSPKPLNYVSLDMSCMEAGGGDGRTKSRHSSDADEKQPTISYAEIDFVKSRNFCQTADSSKS